MIKNFIKIFFTLSLMFASSQGAGSNGSFENFYENRLQTSFEKLKPLQDYAKKRQSVYIVSGIIAIIVFAVFVKYFKLFGAVVSLLMIAGGVYYLKLTKPVIDPYKKAFNEQILSQIGTFCCGYRYIDSFISQEDVINSNLFSPKIKNYSATSLFVKEGVRFGYVKIEFYTKEDESVEKFADNVFSGFVIIVNKKNSADGVLVSEMFKEKVADIDPEFNAFFSPLPRGDKIGGFEIYGKIDGAKMNRYHMLAYQDVALAFTKDKTYIFYALRTNPLDVSVYKDFYLKDAKAIKSVFERIDSFVKIVKK